VAFVLAAVARLSERRLRYGIEKRSSRVLKN
jgi:hypothetical protein